MVHEKQKAVLNFWFGDDSLRQLDQSATWFAKDPIIDRTIAENFGDLVDQARTGAFDDWARTPSGALALVILLDQFPRNIFRDDVEAFALDTHALKIAQIAVAAGFDQQLTVIERCFLYLPYEHSEVLDVQEESVELFLKLKADALDGEKAFIDQTLLSAVEHREIIARFGRFPHRNEILGRESTTDEQIFLRQPNSSF